MPLSTIGAAGLDSTSANSDGSGAITIPAGTTAQRPASPANGMLRYNTSLNSTELYANGVWVTIGRPLGSQQNPASSPAAILADNSASPDGFYYYITNGTIWGGFTKFNWHQGRNWICILKVLNRGDMPSGSAFWTNATLQNDSDTNITGGSWSKYGGWNNFTFTRVALDMNGVFPAIMIYNTSRTMFNAMQNNAAAAFGGLACDDRSPQFSAVRYDSAGFYFSGGPFAVQANTEQIIQQYGINSFANSAAQANPDNAGLASVARAGARVGAPMDEGAVAFNGASGGGADSGFGFGFCGGNPGRTGSCGYAEWSASTPINTLPGRLWVS